MVIRKRQLFEYVADDLAARIFGGTIQPGDRLATEHQLCAEFGVSRTVIRDTLRFLASRGLIEAKPHSGTIVRGIEHWNFLDSRMIGWARGMGTREGFFDMLFEARNALESQTVRIAALKAGADDLVRIEAALLRMEAAAALDPPPRADFNRADVEFHLAILEATHNLILRQFGAVIRTALLASFELSLEAEKLSMVSVAAHRGVFEAIRAGTPEAAREQMEVICGILQRNVARQPPMDAATDAG